jgi:multifunctional methyltransferase subunit TRM112
MLLTTLKLGFPELPEQKPEEEETTEAASEEMTDDTPTPATKLDEKTLRDLHILLMETNVLEGKLVCGNCGHEYAIKEGIANFLLPGHLV